MSFDDARPGSSALVLQHRDDAPGGLLNDVLAEHGLRPSTVRVDLGERLPDPDAFSLAVSLGWDRGDSAPAEIEWLREADRVGTAVLGLGSGAQALAVALGGGVRHSAKPRYGWVWISSSTPRWIADGPWLAWRDDVIALPRRARLLAYDPLGPQAFAAGRHLGVQFHPEITPEIVASWVTGGRNESLDAQGVLEVASREFATASAAARRLLSTYLHSLDEKE